LSFDLQVYECAQSAQMHRRLSNCVLKDAENDLLIADEVGEKVFSSVNCKTSMLTKQSTSMRQWRKSVTLKIFPIGQNSENHRAGNDIVLVNLNDY